MHQAVGKLGSACRSATGPRVDRRQLAYRPGDRSGSLSPKPLGACPGRFSAASQEGLGGSAQGDGSRAAGVRASPRPVTGIPMKTLGWERDPFAGVAREAGAVPPPSVLPLSPDGGFAVGRESLPATKALLRENGPSMRFSRAEDIAAAALSSLPPPETASPEAAVFRMADGRRNDPCRRRWAGAGLRRRLEAILPHVRQDLQAARHGRGGRKAGGAPWMCPSFLRGRTLPDLEEAVPCSCGRGSCSGWEFSAESAWKPALAVLSEVVLRQRHAILPPGRSGRGACSAGAAISGAA